MVADVLDHPHVVARDGVPAAALHRRPLARAEAAVHRADVGRHQQGAVGVAVGQAADRRVLVLVERVLLARPRPSRPAPRRGDRLEPDRVVGIEGVDQREVVGGDRQLVAGPGGGRGPAARRRRRGGARRAASAIRTACCDCQRQSFQSASGDVGPGGVAPGAGTLRGVGCRAGAWRLVVRGAAGGLVVGRHVLSGRDGDLGGRADGGVVHRVTRPFGKGGGPRSGPAERSGPQGPLEILAVAGRLARSLDRRLSRFKSVVAEPIGRTIPADDSGRAGAGRQAPVGALDRGDRPPYRRPETTGSSDPDGTLRMPEPLRLMVVGAHPDDAEYKAGGLAALYRRHGHARPVRLDDQRLRRAPPRRRARPWPPAAGPRPTPPAAILGLAYEIWDHPDGRLVPDPPAPRGIDPGDPPLAARPRPDPSA